MRIVGNMLMAGALAATAAFSPVLAAGPAYDQGSVRVQTADLDLSSQAGQRQLEKRLSAGVTKLCGSPVLFTRDELSALDACRADALTAAATQIDAARSFRAVSVASNK